LDILCVQKHARLHVYWLMLDKELTNGLVAMLNDADIVHMINASNIHTPCGESTSELVSVPISSCDFISMFNFRLYNPLDCPRSVYRILVVFLFRSVSVRIFSQF
jgi:hypothetical protein